MGGQSTEIMEFILQLKVLDKKKIAQISQYEVG